MIHSIPWRLFGAPHVGQLSRNEADCVYTYGVLVMLTPAL
jgi:hypothetical protein